ncbi:MAG TPA: TonB-dependent receptor [Candidatus Methylacidiphilales bacterium]|nr:TonB-dependent receptor [Candidatus Methylacidiphilales bacterium]
MQLRFLCRLSAVSILVITCWSVPAYSQPVKSDLQEVVVTAQKTTDKDKPSSPLTIPSATSAREQLEKVAGGTNFINADEYRNGRVSTIKDALDFQPGVIVQPRFGSDESRLSIRGSGIQRTFHGRGLQFLQDGVPLNQADGGFDFQGIDALAVDYIEVYRGANALEYGGATLGGSINYISPTGYNSRKLQGRFEAGSFGYLRGQVSSGMVMGPFDYYATVTHFSQDGFREHAQQSAQRLATNVGWRIDENLETRFYVNYTSTYSELPGDLTKAAMNSDPTQAAGPLPGPVSRFDRVRSNWMRNFDLVRIANTTSLRIDGDQRLDFTGAWTWKSLDHPILFAIDQLSNDWVGDIHYTNTADLCGMDNRFVVGIAPAYGTVQDNRYINNAGNRGNRFFDSSMKAGQGIIYGENELRVMENLSVISGMQLIWARREMDEQIPLRVHHYDDYFGINPKLGARYDINERTNVFANISRSFEPPSFGELMGNVPAFPEFSTPFDAWTPLEAQTATTVELGSRGEIGRFRWDVTAYHSWVDNELLSYQIAPGLERTINGTATHHQGVEVGLHATLAEHLATTRDAKPDSLTLRQTYTWSNFYFDSDPAYGRNDLPGIPEHFYRAELMYTHPCGFYVGPNVEWSISSYNVDFANTLKADPYTLLGLKAGWKCERPNGGGFSIFLEAKNLTNETYAATTSLLVNARGQDSAVFSPGDGRGFFGGVEWKW